MEAIPKFDIKSVIKFDISTKLTKWPFPNLPWMSSHMQIINEINIIILKQSVDERTSDLSLQEIKENLQRLNEILRPIETRILIIHVI